VISLRELPKPNAKNLVLMNLIMSQGRRLQTPFYQDLQMAPEQHTLTIGFGNSAPTTTNQYQSVKITCNLGAVTLFIQTSFLELLCEISLPGWRDEDADALPWDVCVTYVLSRLCALADFDAGEVKISNLKTKNNVREAAIGCVLWADVRLGDVTYPIAVQIQNCDAERVGHAFRTLTGRSAQRWVDPGFPMRLGLTPLRLRMSQLRAIVPGTILTAGQIGSSGCPVVGVLLGLMRMRGHLDVDCNLTFDEIKKGNDIMEDDEKEVAKADQEFDQAAESAPTFGNVHDIDALPVVLDMTFPPLRLSLKDLTGLTVGSSFAVGCRLTDTLKIRANGQVVGEGCLINLDGVLGLQVTEWKLHVDPETCTS
jgi:flagellar motor switch/type III secretory pathway protein FliN